MSEKGLSPLVSISCVTYNHEKFIRQTLDGFLCQKTTFPFEILIHDDASEDRTADIIREYHGRYPEVIFPIYQLENQYSKGFEISPIWQFPRARGKFIALCEGDDYWTDPYKLQKQIDYMLLHPDTVLCSARTVFYQEQTRQFEKVVPESGTGLLEETCEKAYFSGYWGRTSSRVIPTRVLQEIPSRYVRDFKSIHWILAHYPTSRIACLDEVVAVYRVHSAGLFSGATDFEKWKVQFESRLMIARLYSGWKRMNMLGQALRYAGKMYDSETLTGWKKVKFLVLLHKTKIRHFLLRIFGPAKPEWL